MKMHNCSPRASVSVSNQRLLNNLPSFPVFCGPTTLGDPRLGGAAPGLSRSFRLPAAACRLSPWLVEETFTIDEVSEVLNGLQAVVHSEVESELINTAYTNVLLLRQLFAQAEKWYLKLQTDISELENRELLEQVAEFEKAEITSSNKKPILDVTKPKLAPLNEGGTAELLNKEILRLQEENEKLKSRLKTVEIQATNALDEKSKLEKALQDLQLDQGNQKDFIKAQDLSNLENTVAALKSEFQKTLNDKTENQKSLEENLATAKHDLLRVQEQLHMAEK
ncbi:leucine zipper transcription factor-like protein 1 isoform X2 [Pongo abelii]|nr:leucine zipper transcription factor-like protein 1 isoform X2 [Pongo abelii]